MSAKIRRPPVSAAVAEIQGLYGPFTFPEYLLQKIWERRDFDAHHAATADGRRVRIEHTGKWNRIGGPDFKNALLRIGGDKLAGDVEVHLRESDWDAHRHANDPAYANVVLHVVLFPPRRNTTPGANACDIPVLSLLPLLHHDLEQYAADDAIEHLAAHSLSRANKTLSALTQDALRATLARHAEKRWRQKIHFARLRVEKLGWDEACHHAALEILGYSRNRAAMLDVAGKYPLRAWVKSAGLADVIFAEWQEAHAWAPQATRPANHPRTRLRQYAAWVSARPAWTQALPEFAKCFPAGGDLAGGGGLASGSLAGGDSISGGPASGYSTSEGSTSGDIILFPNIAAWRRDSKAVGLRKRIRSEICGNALGGTRLDTFVCDGLLPLLVARNVADDAASNTASGMALDAVLGAALGAAWRNWFVGDMPAHFAKQLRALGVTGTRATPAHNGAMQGLLGFLLEEEM